MDFTKIKINRQVNKKSVTKTKISSSIRTISEIEKVKPKVEMKNFNISMYKQVYCGCDKCGTETIHVLKGESCECIYCNGSYKVNEYSRTAKNINSSIPYIYGIFLL